MPLGASFLGFLISILLKSKKLFFVTLGFLYFFSIGITSDFLNSYIEKPYEMIPFNKVKSAKAIVVLSGMREFITQKQEIIEWKDPDRFFAAIRLFREGKTSNIIFTGGHNPFYLENILDVSNESNSHRRCRFYWKSFS